jgi:hypothetical protein
MLSWWLHHKIKTNSIDCTEKWELFYVPVWLSDGEAREPPLGSFSVELSSTKVKDFVNASAVRDLDIVSEVQNKSA